MKHLCLLIFSLITLVPNVYAQIELRSRQMRTTDGLPSNSVRHIYQDSKGFLWLGTLNGLSRYDGNTFLNFKPEAADREQISLADSHINKLQEDKNGFLWIGTSPQLFSCYDLQKGCFVDFTGCGELKQNYSGMYIATNGEVWLWHHNAENGARQIRIHNDRTMTSVKYKAELGNLPDNRVRFVKEDASGRIWIGTMRGLVSVYKGNFKIEDKKYRFKSAVAYKQDMYFLTEEGHIYCYYEGSGTLSRMTALSTGKAMPTGNLILKNKWIIFTDIGGYEYDFETRSVIPSSRLNIKKGQTVQDNKKDNWVYNHTGRVYYVCSQTGEIKEFRLIPEDKVKHIDLERYHIVHDSRGIVWISTYGNGLFSYNVSEDTLEHFTFDMDKNSLINSDFLLYLIEDRAGSIWAASEYSGLTRITVSNEGTTRIFPESPELFDRSNSVRMLTRAKNDELWVGTRKGGLYKYDAQLNLKDIQYVETNIYVVKEDSMGRSWTGTRGQGLRIGDTWYKSETVDPTSISNNHIFSIFRDQKNRMWIGTFGGGLNLAVPTADGKYKFRHFLNQKYGLNMVRSIAEDKKGMIWVGTSEGICIFHPDSLIANGDNYRLFSYSNNMFCSNVIKCFYCDDKGRMWVGTSGGGLNLCVPTDDYTSLKYENYGISEGLPHEVVQSILSDDMGRLWVATEYGISRFNPENRSFENFFFAAHTLGNVYSDDCACVDADGKLLFGTNYGLTVIDPKKIPSNESFSPVVFANLYINGIRMNPQMEDSPLEQSLAYSDEIKLKYFQNSFMLDFSIFDYSDSEQTKFKYWLENYDKGWSEPSSMNFASYKYLDPGTYIFHVKSCNGAGVWNEKETVLKIVIIPPFWKSNWALLGYIILMLIAFYFTFRIIRNFSRLRNRINVEKQLTEYKLVFFTNISHEFRTPLTLIQGAMEKIQRIGNIPRDFVNPLQTMDKSTQRMLRLINQLLEFRKMQHGKLALSLEETDVIAFLYEIFLSFGDVAEQKNMTFQFLPSVLSYTMYIDKGNLDKVVHNLLSNAIKYTPANGTILFKIGVSEAKKTLLIQVSDTGVGIPKEKQGELFKRFMQSSFSNDSIGVGLHLTHELVTVHKGTIEFKENEGGGSVFSVRLPVDESVYEEKDFLVSGHALLKEVNGSAFPSQILADDASTSLRMAEPLNKRRVLIIEDDNDIRELLRQEIGVYFEVEVAADGTSGLEKARSEEFDLIVCDVLMPGLTGFEVTKRLKNDFETSHIPIILLTALSSPEKQLEGIDAGADAYISKPFSIKYLLTRVFRLIEQREKLREKFTNEPGSVHAAMYSTDRDKEFTDRMFVVLNSNMSRSDFSIEEFAQQMKLGRTVFYKKFRGITGYSPIEYLRIVRIKKAAELLLCKDRQTVAEVAYQVGFSDPFYFSKCFKEQFGIAPSAYQKGGEKSM